MKKSILKYGMLLIVLLIIPAVSWAVNQHSVTIHYMLNNSSKETEIHTTYLKNVSEGNTINLKDYAFDLKEHFGLFGYKYANKTYVDDNKKDVATSLTVDDNHEVYIYYESLPKKYISRTYVVKYDTKGNVAGIENVSSTGEKTITDNQVTIKSDSVSGATYAGYIETYNRLGNVSKETISDKNLRKSREVVINKNDNVSFVCIDFIYKKNLKDDFDVVKKSAYWDNAEKTKANIEIEVTPRRIPEIMDSDIILMFDTSGTSSQWAGISDSSLLGSDGHGSFAESMRRLAPDGEIPVMDLIDMELYKNTVSIITFSTRVQAFNAKGGVFTNSHGPRTTPPPYCGHNNYNGLGYSKTEVIAEDYVFGKRRNLSKIEKMNQLFANMKADYQDQFDSWWGTSLNDQIKGALIYGWDGHYTVYDPPMFFAEWYFDRLYKGKSDKENGRNGYIIMVTDASPRAGSDTRGSTGVYSSNQRVFRDTQNCGNMFYDITAKNLRDKYGIEIFMLIPSGGAMEKSCVENIAGDFNNAVKVSNSGSGIKTAMMDALDKLLQKMTTQPMYYKVEDIINDDILKTGKGNIKYECYNGAERVPELEKKVVIDGNKVSWDLSDFIQKHSQNSIKKLRLVLSVELKDEYKNETILFNTNKIDDKGNDIKCKYDYPNGSNTVDSPWLQREESPDGTITVNLILSDWEDGKTIKVLKSSSSPAAIDEPYTFDCSKLGVDISNFEYKGYEVLNKTVKGSEIKKIDVKKLMDGLKSFMTSEVSVQKDDSEKTINYYVVHKKGGIKILHGYVDGNDFVVFDEFSKKDIKFDYKNENIVDTTVKNIKELSKSDRKDLTYLGHDVFTKKPLTYNVRKYLAIAQAGEKYYKMDSKNNTANVVLNANTTEALVVFVYKLTDFMPINMEIVHYDSITNEEIFNNATRTRIKTMLSKLFDGLKDGASKTSLKNNIDKTKSFFNKGNEFLKGLDNCELKDNKEFKSIVGKKLLYVDARISSETYFVDRGANNESLNLLKEYDEDGTVLLPIKELAKKAKSDDTFKFNSDDDILTVRFVYGEEKKTVNVSVNHILIKEDGTEFSDNEYNIMEEPKDIGVSLSFGPDSAFMSNYDCSYTGNDKNKLDSALNASENEETHIVSFTTQDIGKDIELNFYYKESTVTIISDPPEPPSGDPPVIPSGDPPDFDVEIIPSGDPLYGESGDPYYVKPGEKSKLIVLDDTFQLHLEVKNNDKISSGDVYVKFPFDVYYFEDTTNGKVGILTGSQGKFLKANEEIMLEHVQAPVDKHLRYYFRLPSWVIEKVPSTINPNDIYEVKARISAVEKNTKIGVVGRIYDFTVTNVNEGGDNHWNTSLFKGKNLGREYKADILPIAQRTIKPNISALFDKEVRENNTQPRGWEYALLLGAKFTFSINTKGVKSRFIDIEPKLIYFDANGNDRTDEVTYKYADGLGFKLEFASKGGKVLAKRNLSTSLNSSDRMNDEVRNESTSSMALNKYGDNNIVSDTGNDSRNVKNQFVSTSVQKIINFGTLSNLIIPTDLRLPYINYAKKNLKLSEVNKIGYSFMKNASEGADIKVPAILQYVDTSAPLYCSSDDKNTDYIGKISTGGTSTALGLNEDVLVNSLGHWYGEYYLPSSLEVYDKDNKRLKEGNIIVAFKISSLYEETPGGNKKHYLNYSTERSIETGLSGWHKENVNVTAGSSLPLKLILPEVSKTYEDYKYDYIKNGYYPVAVYSTNALTNDVGQTH